MARGSGSKRRAWWKTSSAQTRRSTTFTLEAPTPVKVNWSPWYHMNLKYFCLKGDSGGPLFRWYDTKNGRRAFILGSVSRGTGCANFNSPGIFSRVTQHLDWIRWIQWILINVQCIATHVDELKNWFTERRHHRRSASPDKETPKYVLTRGRDCSMKVPRLNDILIKFK